MVDIVNLRQARKRKQRDDRARAAEDNRTKFGRAATDRKLAQRGKALEEERLEGHKRTPADDADV